MRIATHGYNRGVIDVASHLDVGGSLDNRGRIRVAQGVPVPDDITGRPPVVTAYDEAPALASSYPRDGAVDVLPDSTILLTFSEPATAIRNWYSVTLADTAATQVPVRTCRRGPRTYAIDPLGPLPAGTEVTVRLAPGLVLDQDPIDPPGAMSEYFPFVREIERSRRSAG
ncbi:Ig-like domain-containing protein [Nocardioides mangrovi]|uniref:Ig-like domain-containing protein n=1 Tax=Nocardioides mangrovi TaxID=2874580 RepID=A0ABS7UEH4_9ACTN|nr:Ig-like domain-containing protein [Nocardioides mangrovi]MBZ5739403.1 Ig-like domain-containing protein [Nocardioides mangrovi]